ncbi:unnamed protein product [Miscanthus lutarioriparius]|uniref:Uncharacterized protein n=1 Tax=Miscanthus lutarioriparius TaxID=422564 RepID=A0A811PEL9_9POAL|nr:unnamed protein product [Miscanthus lutarioriparius]
MMEGHVRGQYEKEVAVVTGGNRGIGLEICKQLASKGVTVVLTARDEKRGAEAVKNLASQGLSNVLFHQLEVGDLSSAARLADFIREKFGKLDILVNNAAIAGSKTEISNPESFKLELAGMNAQEKLERIRRHTTDPYDKAEECLRTNYHGTKIVTEALLPLLHLSSHGRIVNISSRFGLLRFFSGEELKKELNNINNLSVERLDELSELFLKDFENGQLEPHGWPVEGGYPAYKVSKALANACSRIIAKKHPTLCINCVHPGYVNTDMNFHTGVLTVEEGTRGALILALLPKGGMTGAYLDCTEVASFVVAVVTGGNRGIGLEICKQLASNGITVVLTARDEKRGAEAVSTLGLSNVVYHQLEVSDPSSAARLADFIKEKFGKLDILVNNAGITGTTSNVGDLETFRQELAGMDDLMERIQTINKHITEPYEEAEKCLSFLFCSPHPMEGLLTCHLTMDYSGSILLQFFSGDELKEELNNIDSLSEQRVDELSELFLKDFKDGQLEARGWPKEGGFISYKESKALANAYSRILAKEHPSLCINCVHPGYVETDMNFQVGHLTVEELS